MNEVSAYNSSGKDCVMLNNGFSVRKSTSYYRARALAIVGIVCGLGMLFAVGTIGYAIGLSASDRIQSSAPYRQGFYDGEIASINTMKVEIENLLGTQKDEAALITLVGDPTYYVCYGEGCIAEVVGSYVSMECVQHTEGSNMACVWTKPKAEVQ